MHSIKQAIPQDGISGLVRHWKQDLTAGGIVFFIALPLCLGIAMASGTPPVAGIFAGIIGGMLVSLIGGSYVAINGPAAGLIVVIMNAINVLGNGNIVAGYPKMLAAVVVAGGLLIIFGLLKAGTLSTFFPSAAVHGLLAAIGIIIMSKQIHTLVGQKVRGHETLDAILEIPQSIELMNPEVTIVGIVSLLLLIIWPLMRNKWVRAIPPPIVVILVAIPLEKLFDMEYEHQYIFWNKEYHIGPEYLVELPANLLDGIMLPDFSDVWSVNFAMVVITIALIQGLESLVIASAVEKLDPYHRKPDLNRDMIAVGAGSMVSGAIGGLPMIAEIVRSSANISNGAQTRWANFFHGFLMLAAVALIPGVIHQIPLTALAAMLIITGYRLASPKVFQEIAEIGRDQLLIFIVTIVATLATDLLLGIMTGIVLELMINLFRGVSLNGIFRSHVTINEVDKEHLLVQVKGAAIFSNFITMNRMLNRLSPKKEISIDFSGCKIIDATVNEHLEHWISSYEQAGGKCEVIGLDKHTAISEHPLATRVMLPYPPKEKTVILTPRQRSYQTFALAHGLEYLPGRVYTRTGFESFNLVRGRSIRFIENRMIQTIEGCHLLLAEILLVEGSGISERDYVFSALRIEHPELHPPVFQLQKEDLFDKIADAAVGADIDFAEHPRFSDHYLLKGTDEAAVRAYFSVELIQFFEQHTGYCVESNGSALLIYLEARPLTYEERVMMLQMGREMTQILLKHPQLVHK